MVKTDEIRNETCFGIRDDPRVNDALARQEPVLELIQRKLHSQMISCQKLVQHRGGGCAVAALQHAQTGCSGLLGQRVVLQCTLRSSRER